MSKFKRFEELFCSFHVWTFFRKGGGLLNSKLSVELFCLCLEIFQERGGGGYLIPKLLRNFSARGLRKVPQSIPKIQGGGSRRFGKIPNRSIFFLRRASITYIYVTREKLL